MQLVCQEFGHDDMFPLCSHNDAADRGTPLSLWSLLVLNHSTTKSTRVVHEANSSAISFDESIVLLVCMVWRYCKEHSLGLLNSELTFIELLGYLRMLY